ncbi:MAG: lipoate--protein ligase family protein [Acidobacteria bacterium]|nr:MAG: lipoate--protein ligase family protein [Acidobacteriota bacterium]
MAGKLDNMLSTTLFHAMAELGHTGLILCEPKDKYVSLGYFDNAEELIDLEKCKELGIGVIRRRIGGGAVLLAPGQVFYQLILPKNLVPFKVEDAYRKLSKPVIEAYRRLGLEVEYKPINDLVVKAARRKISGQGAGDIGRNFVFVGNILLKFEPELMAEVLKVPKESFRELLKKSLWENIGWLEREIGTAHEFEEVAHVLFESFSKELPLEGMAQLPEDAFELAQKLKEEMTSEESIREETPRRHPFIKIREGVYVRNVYHDGLEFQLVVADGKIAYLRGFGQLDRMLIGLPYSKEELIPYLNVKGVEAEKFTKLLFDS